MAAHPLIRRTAEGGAWLALGTAFAQVTQLGYAAITSRLLDPSAFGAYAVALTVTGLVALLARAGLDDAAARSVDTGGRSIRVAATWAIGIGIAVASLVWLSAPLWGAIFGNGAATPVLRTISLALTFTPYYALVSGVARSQGNFKRWTLASLGWTLAGVAIGLFVVTAHPTASALVVPLITLTVGMTLSHRFFCNTAVLPVASLREGLPHLAFGSKVTLGSLIEYLGQIFNQIAVSRGISAAALGQWNRAGAFAVTPIWAMVQSLTRAIFPEFGQRWDRSSGASLLESIAYVSLWVGLIGSLWWGCVVAYLLPSLIGEQWRLAASLSVPLALAAGLAFAVAPLLSALQSGDEFRGYLKAQTIGLAIMATAALATLLTGVIAYSAVAYPLTGLLRLVMVRRAARACGLVVRPSPRPRGTSQVTLALLAAGAMVAFFWPRTEMPGAVVATIVTSLLAAAAALVWWRDSTTKSEVAQLLRSPQN